MQTMQLGGPIGPLQDPATGQPVNAQASGSFTYQLMQPGAEQTLPMVQAALLRATGMVLAQKLATGQVAIPTLPQSLPYFHQEIVAQSGASAYGVQITALTLDVRVEAGAPAPMPPNPQEAMKAAFAQAAKDRLDPSNYEVRARVDVGGFRVKASTDGGLDTAGLKEQAKEKVKSTVTWWLIGCGAMAFVGLLVCGLGGYIWYKARQSIESTSLATTQQAAAWDGTSPYTCSGNDNARIEGVTATFAAGTAVQASGNCRLVLANVNLTAPTVVETSANAHVTVEGGSLTGTEAAARATGNSTLLLQGTRVSGPTQRLGNATLTGP